jgi:hypothetical protein
MGPIRCPETSVKVYHSKLRNTPEKRRSHEHCGGSVKSREENADTHIWDRECRGSAGENVVCVVVEGCSSL